jgi:hypothetical protein
MYLISWEVPYQLMESQMKRPTKEDWFNVASICGEWIRGQAEWLAPGGGDVYSARVSFLLWNYYKEIMVSGVWQLYHKTLDEAAIIIDPIQPFNVTCENEMFVALQIACEKAGLCR